jgi:hypothetical protein
MFQFANASEWKTEVTKMRDFLTKFSNVPADDILGARAPSLKLGYNVSAHSGNFRFRL